MEFSLLLNVNIKEMIKLGRDLRQGDPLLPILFILWSKVLTRLLAKEEVAGNLYGIKVDRNDPAITHLMYADDLLVMSRAKLKDVEVFQKCFETYCGWLRKTANLEKSNILFSKFTGRKAKKEIMDSTRLKKMGPSAIYLGKVLFSGRNQTKEFNSVKERIQMRLEGWNNHLLSKAGNAVLIKAVAQAIPTYTMSTFRLPSSVCKKMDSAVKRFWWATKSNSGRYLAMKSW